MTVAASVSQAKPEACAGTKKARSMWLGRMMRMGLRVSRWYGVKVAAKLPQASAAGDSMHGGSQTRLIDCHVQARLKLRHIPPHTVPVDASSTSQKRRLKRRIGLETTIT